MPKRARLATRSRQSRIRSKNRNRETAASALYCLSRQLDHRAPFRSYCLNRQLDRRVPFWSYCLSRQSDHPFRSGHSHVTRSAGTEASSYTENGTQYPGPGYSEVSTSLAIDASGILRSRFALKRASPGLGYQADFGRAPREHPAPSGESSIGVLPPREPFYFQKFLNRPGESSVYLTVCWIFLCPRYACRLLVSCPLFASANPQACRSIWGWVLKPRPAASPARSKSLAKPPVVNGEPRSLVNTNGDLGSCSRCSFLKARSSSPGIGWVAGDPALTLRTCSAGSGEIDLIPTEIDQFGCPQAMAIGDQDHGGVPIARAVLAGRPDQLLDLSCRQMFPGADLGIRTSSWGDCPIYSGWGDDVEG